ncbi:hypothetical protein O181_012417 [Austropuccinia psidii MF-1]|uniref:CUE domain-containing protein n=1 Tax=Austropuccinia psidii MF-1 TaxID=1389203 RepID=A0A9Q3BWF3_9BASI|nr:hypothetical protein [Austropuccinia psidii MF-1]
MSAEASKSEQIIKFFSKFNSIPNELNLNRQFIQLLSEFIHSVLINLTNSTRQQPPLIRESLIKSIYNLNQRNIPLPTQSWLPFIVVYGPLNRSIVQAVIKTSIELIPSWKQQLQPQILALQNQILSQPNQSRHALTLRLIGQSSHDLSESFYAPLSNNFLISIINLYQSNNLNQKSKKQYLSCIINFIRFGLLEKLKILNPSVDLLKLTEEFLQILTQTPRLLNDLILNIPEFIHQLKLVNSNLSPSNHIHNLNQSINQIQKILQGFDSIIQDIIIVLPDLNQTQLKAFIYRFNKYQDVNLGAQNFIQDYFNKPSLLQQKSKLTHSKETNQINVLKNRKNLFDQHQMDPNLLRLGKNQLEEKAILNDKSHLTQEIKQKIKSTAENKYLEFESQPILYSDESETEEINRKTQKTSTSLMSIFINDDDYDEEGGGNVKAFDSNLIDNSDSESSLLTAQNQFNWIKEPILCSAYLAHPDIFSKKARSTSYRKELMSKLNVDKDDLVESWGIMFERNPKKEEILAKYSVSKNVNRQRHVNQEGSDRSHATGRPAGRGRGRGRGRGGNNGGAGEGKGKNVQNNKESQQVNGGNGQRHHHNKKAHERRVRGRDQKLSRLGGI